MSCKDFQLESSQEDYKRQGHTSGIDGSVVNESGFRKRKFDYSLFVLVMYACKVKIV